MDAALLAHAEDSDRITRPEVWVDVGNRRAAALVFSDAKADRPRVERVARLEREPAGDVQGADDELESVAREDLLDPVHDDAPKVNGTGSTS